VPLHDEDVAVAGDHDIVRLIQFARAGGFIPFAGLSPRADRQQCLTVAVHLDHDVRSDVGRPQVALPVDAQAVRTREQFVAERTNERAIAIELEECLVATGQDDEMPVCVKGNAR
jgi:hypothetical protein